MPSKPTNPAASTETPTKSGITTDANGQRLIPSSVRSDGSVRREIRIRPGYRPPEDVEVYKNRTAEAWRTRGSGGVPGAEPAAAPADDAQGKSRNAKRRAAKKKAAAESEGDGVPTAAAAGEGESAAPAPAATAEEAQADEEAREAKKLAKKLRQARDLKDKKDKGAALLPEQFEKVIRISELIRQLEGLGFDANGEKLSDGP
jgi:partner of Y14 and mago protein